MEIKMAQVKDNPNRPSIDDNFEIPRVKVDLLYPTSERIHVYTHQALTKAYNHDATSGWNLMGSEHARFSGANISKARNELVSLFLQGDAEWAMFLDTDMVISDDTIARLLLAAEVSGADVISGLCVMIGASGPIPTIYEFGNFSAGEVTRVAFDYPDKAILQVAATGTACLMVKREVFETIAAAHPNNPYPWFREDVINGEWISEDIYFCLQANSFDHPVFVDCNTPVGHAKGSRVWMPEDIRKESSMPDQHNVVVIPVKNKLKMTKDLVAQLREQDETDEIIIVDNGSGKEMRNWLSCQDDITVLDMPDAGIHEMWNAATNTVTALSQKRNINVTFLNNDIVIGDNFISNMAKALRSSKGLMAVCANYDGREISDLYETTADICAARYDGTGGFAGFAFTVKVEWFHSGYAFPEECKWWGGDNDLVNMITVVAKGTVGISRDATVVHIDGGSLTAGDPAWSKFKEQTTKDMEALAKRWEGIMSEIAKSQEPSNEEG